MHALIMLSFLGILVRICRRRCLSIKHFSLFITGLCPVHVVNSAYVESLIFLSGLKKNICICVYTVLSSVVEKALTNVIAGVEVASVCLPHPYRSEAVAGFQSVQLKSSTGVVEYC